VLQVKVPMSSKSLPAAEVSGRIHKMALPPPKSWTSSKVPVLVPVVMSKPISPSTIALEVTLSLRMPVLVPVARVQEAVFRAVINIKQLGRGVGFSNGDLIHNFFSIGAF